MRSRHRTPRPASYVPPWRADATWSPLDPPPSSYGPPSIRAIGHASRYEILARIAAGGMGTVYLARMRGAAGFWRLCAIKRPHAQAIEDPLLRRGFVEEARLASLLHHPNVVPIIDVEEAPDGGLALVMDFIEGASLGSLLGAGPPLAPPIIARVLLDTAAGLAAAHELCDPLGEPLGLVHRDVSPHNVLVGVDGTARLADFGIAKHERSCLLTGLGTLKGKFSYMAPEYVRGHKVDARGDVFALGVVAWEAFTGRRLFTGEGPGETLQRVLEEPAPPLSAAAQWMGQGLDAVIAAALEKSPDARIPTARAFGEALEAAARASFGVAPSAEVGAAVRRRAAEPLAALRRVLAERLRDDAPPASRRPRALRDPVFTAAPTTITPPPVGEELAGAPTVCVKRD